MLMMRQAALTLGSPPRQSVGRAYDVLESTCGA
jgi:hypothetical protein